MSHAAFGPSGEDIFYRTYSRTKPDGAKEDLTETVKRVVDGNLAFVDAKHHQPGEREALIEMMTSFMELPAGRHLWTTGVKGRQFINNCWVAGWLGDDPAEHFRFTLLRLMEGGGVGANYSDRFMARMVKLQNQVKVHIVCHPEHTDYEDLEEAGLLSSEYNVEWPGSYEIEDSREGWANALGELVDTVYRPSVLHTNRVFDVSRVRCAGSRIKTGGGTASGPKPLAELLTETGNVLSSSDGLRMSGLEAMAIDHEIGKCVVAGGSRRSARMSIKHWSDPDIIEFINAKAGSAAMWTTNISVEVDNAFYDALEAGDHLAEDVLEHISEGMWLNGEPGIWNSSMSNIGEPNAVTCTNPCGEITLEEWEQCNLGHVNLDAVGAFQGDQTRAIQAHRLMTRFLIRATFSEIQDEKSEAVRARNRRIGVGHFGYAAAVAKADLPYSEASALGGVKEYLHLYKDVVDQEAATYAHELRIPVPVKTTTVAPTGTIAKLPGTTEGIHPVFARHFLRRIRFSSLNPNDLEIVQRYREQGFSVVPDVYAANTIVVEIPTEDKLFNEVKALYGEERAYQLVQSPAELTLDEMVATQAMYQEHWADNAVSFTANFYPSEYTPYDIGEVIRGAKVKGLTMFPELGMKLSPYERLTQEEYEAYTAKAVSDSVDEACISGACPVR